MDNLAKPLFEQWHIVSIAEPILFPDHVYRTTTLEALLWFTISIDRHFFGYAVKAVFYLSHCCPGLKAFVEAFDASSIPWFYPTIAQYIM